MPQSFAGQNLKGRSFKGQDLTNADFSGAQIQGADFSQATLTGANFSQATAGVSIRSLLATLLLLMLSGCGIGFMGVVVADTVNTDYFQVFGPRDAIIAFTTLILFSVCLYRRGLLSALTTTLLSGVLAWILFLVWEYWQTGDFLHGLIGASSITVDVITTIIIFWSGIGSMVSICGVLTASIHFQTHRRRLPGRFELLTWLCAFPIGILGVYGLPGTLFKINSVLDPIILWLLSLEIARQILREDPRYGTLRSLSLTLASFGGTCFRGAQLTAANFSQARLNAADFTGATYPRAGFARSHFLQYARAGDGILRQPRVRKLLVTGMGTGQSYQGCDLQGANLVDTELTGANLSRADLSYADLTGAQLANATLIQTQAIGTCFRGADLTGSCLEAWNIDTTTDLNGVVCDYVYLLSNQQERRPSYGNFQPGDFTKRFQDVLHTVDLIFRQGLDMSAFMAAFQQVQSQQAESGEAISVRSIENKGDGVVLVKVEVPESADKPQIQVALSQEYEQTLQRLEARYQAELAAKDAQIDLYRQHQSELTQLTALLTQPHISASTTSQSISQSTSQSTSQSIAPPHAVPQRLVLKLGNADAKGIPVTLQIADESGSPHVDSSGWLPPVDELMAASQRWQQAYRQAIGVMSSNAIAPIPARIQSPPTQVTNVSRAELFDRCHILTAELSTQLNAWLDSDAFRPVRETLLMSLSAESSIRFFLQTDDLAVRSLPFHLWSWFDRYRQAELILSESSYQRSTHHRPLATSEGNQDGKIRVLAILGDSQGLDVERDRALLQQLPEVDVTCLVEPVRSQLNDALWSTHWDILFFAGHSICQNEQQQLRINATEGLTLAELKYALKKSTERGLQLAIINACDGLQLIRDLHELSLPPTIVMRYPVPDAVAQAFLKYFLTAFSQGLPLHQAVRDAREQLQGIESQFPFATWLPVLHQNPAMRSLTWSMLTE
ncbi:MAG: pentapeptide repeat-containing protein [Cyanobacteria bacterium J06643_4]